MTTCDKTCGTWASSMRSPKRAGQRSPFKFGEFVLCRHRQCLCRGKQLIHLMGKTFKTLVFLIGHRPAPLLAKACTGPSGVCLHIHSPSFHWKHLSVSEVTERSSALLGVDQTARDHDLPRSYAADRITAEIRKYSVSSERMKLHHLTCPKPIPNRKVGLRSD